MNPEQVWTEICERYANPERAADLLRQQDEEGLDVVLALFWECAQARGLGLSEQARHEACAWVSDWRAEVVQPLRGARRAMKLMMDRASEVAQLRAQVQAAELQAERMQLGLLCDWLDTYLARSAADDAASC